MSSHYGEIRRQILDGQRSWNCSAGYADIFLKTVVMPLRLMKANGAFDLAESKYNRRGFGVITRIDITGAINLDVL